MKMKWVEVFLVVSSIYGVSPTCYVTPVKQLLQGCKNLKGLTVVSSTEGTVVNDNNCGDLQSITEFKSEPYFRYPFANPTQLYTLMLLDPDVPLMRENEFFLHILRANIPGSALTTRACCQRNGDNFNRYVSLTPLPGTGRHRYICLLFVQVNGYIVQSRDAPAVRPNFNLDEFLRSKRDLCGPVVATQFRLQSAINE